MDRRTLLLLGGGLAAAALTGCLPGLPAPQPPRTPGRGPWTGTVTSYGGRPIENFATTLTLTADTATMDYDGVAKTYPLDDERRRRVDELARYVMTHPTLKRQCEDGGAISVSLSGEGGRVSASYNCADSAQLREVGRLMDLIAPPVADVWLGTIEHRTSGRTRAVTLKAAGLTLDTRLGSSPTKRDSKPYPDELRARVNALVRKYKERPTPLASAGEDRLTVRLRSADPDFYSYYLSAWDGPAHTEFVALLDELYR